MRRPARRRARRQVTARRVLCLHGFRGSGAALRRQMRTLVQGLEPAVEFVYVDAPALAASGFAWWNAMPFDAALASTHGDEHVKHYAGFGHTVRWLTDLFAKQPPFDGIFGFSQGAALAALLVGMRAPDGIATARAPLVFGFAVCVSGFPSNDPRHAALYAATERFALPSLHLIGRIDGVVPAAASLTLATRFQNPDVVEHAGGHVIPSTPEVRAALAALLAKSQS
jgi:pimeloyl-ACP methyl ester carboxylesterase